MSHDRGCFKCGRDVWEYTNCSEPDCVKSHLKTCPRCGNWRTEFDRPCSYRVCEARTTTTPQTEGTTDMSLTPIMIEALRAAAAAKKGVSIENVPGATKRTFNALSRRGFVSEVADRTYAATAEGKKALKATA